jgi:hypothetical protein
VCAAFGLLAVVLFTIPTPLDYLGASSVIKAGIIIILLPAFVRWIVMARPRAMSLDNIPRDALPK